MTTKIIEKNGIRVLVLYSGSMLLPDAQTALQLAMDAVHDQNCRRIAINREALAPDFFQLSTGFAGEMLQKLTNYQVKIAIYGDFSKYTSKPLRDFMRESNRGRQVFFQSDAETAAEKLLHCGG